MRFSEGVWRNRQGFEVASACKVLDVQQTEDVLSVLLSTRPISSRLNTLNGPTITVRVSSPASDVLAIRTEHFSGERRAGRGFDLVPCEAPAAGMVSITDECCEVTSERLSLRFQPRGTWLPEYWAGDKLLATTPPKGTGLARREGASWMYQQLALGAHEYVYGLGERFGPIVKNGQSVDTRNADGGTGSELAYKNVPFFFTNAGYGVFVNHPEVVSFEIGSEWVSRTQFSVEGESLEFFLIYGPSPKEILARYTALTGRAPVIPDWSMGLWLSTSFTTTYNQPVILSLVEEMERREIPLSVFHIDPYWMKPFRWCDFEWDTVAYPQPEEMLSTLRERGVRTCLWINPYIAQASSLFDEACEHGHLLRTAAGEPWQTDYWQAGMGVVDFTNPSAKEWYCDHLRRLLAMGVDTFKADFGENIPEHGVEWFDGTPPRRMRNLYSLLYNQAVFDVVREVKGESNAVIFSRSATVGGQRYPVHWGGDGEATYESMAETLRGGLSLMNSGFGYWAHDIGGFGGTPSPDLFKRWVQWGLLSSHSRLHGEGSLRVPWLFDEEAVVVLQRFTRLKMRLMPYLSRIAEEVADGHPMMRPMVLEFPDDLAVVHLETQYMLGDAILVAPIFNVDGRARYYIPEGRWISLLDGSSTSGPRWDERTYDAFSLPVLVRPDHVLPLGSRSDLTGYEHDQEPTLVLPALGIAHRSQLRLGTSTFEVERDGDAVRIARRGGTGSWQILLLGRDADGVSVGAGVVEQPLPADPPGVLVRVHDDLVALKADAW